VIQVQAAPQRKKNRARGISSGTTFFFVSASSVGTKFAFTQLKKKRWPIQRIPTTTCSQRKTRSKTGVMSSMPCVPSSTTCPRRRGS